MSKITTLFSLKHLLLILSVALNVGLILRVLFESEENSFILHQKQRWSVIGGCGRPQQQHQEEEAHVNRSSLPHLSFSPPSSSTEAQDEGKRVINLDQLHRSGGGCEFHVYDYHKGSWGGDDSGVGFMARARCFGDNQEFWVELKLKGF